jgi:hypothetical protein
MAEAQPSDIGFGYISSNEPSRHVEIPITPASPLKSAMRMPGTPGRKIDNPLSPTFREEQILEKHEESTGKEQVKDLVNINEDSHFREVANGISENQNQGPAS